MQSIAVSVVRNCEDIIVLNVLHHLLLGVDHCIVIDNGSTDGTGELLHTISKRTRRLRVIHDPSEFRQSQMATNVINEFTRRQSTLVIPFDADEFWDTPVREIVRSLSLAEANVVRCPSLNFVQSRSVLSPGRFSWLHAYRRAQLVAEKGMSLSLDRKVAFIEVRQPTKVLFRAHGNIVLETGAHEVTFEDRAESNSEALCCLHLPLRSRRELTTRAYDYEPRFAVVRTHEHHSWQGRLFREAMDRNEGEEQWRANSYDRSGSLDVFGQERPTTRDFRLVRRLCMAYGYSRYLNVPTAIGKSGSTA